MNRWPLLVLALSAESAAAGMNSGENALGAAEAENPLAYLDPIKVGYKRWVDLGVGRAAEVVTLAVRPPLFHIKGFLNSEESQALIHEAHVQHTAISTMGGTTPQETTENVKKIQNQRTFLQFRKMFKYFDKDHNGVLNKKELGRLLHKAFNMPNHDHDLFLKHHNLTNPMIAEHRLMGIDLAQYREWIMKNHPYIMERYSDQVWLEYGKNSTEPLLERAQKITGLPRTVVSGETSLQVLHYGKLGHYSCHYDSPPSHIPNGQIVRIGTLAVFLNEPEAGGQIAFPGADKEGSQNWNVSDWAGLKDQCQVTDSCTNLGGVIVSPKQGDAVLWYNMKANHWSINGKGGLAYGSHEKTDESFNWNSLHCGAEVSRGEKWLANIWFRASLKKSEHVKVPSTLDHQAHY
jgi:hypothetical protein